MFRFGYSSGHRPFLDLMITFKKERAHSKPRILDQTTIIEKSESEERSEVRLAWFIRSRNPNKDQSFIWGQRQKFRLPNKQKIEDKQSPFAKQRFWWKWNLPMNIIRLFRWTPLDTIHGRHHHFLLIPVINIIFTIQLNMTDQIDDNQH